MKRRIAKILGLASIAVLLSMSLMACKAQEKETPDPSPTTAGTEQESTPASTTPSSADALATFVDSQQGAVDKIKESMEGTYSDLGIKSEGDNTFVYYYVFKTEVDADATAAALEGQTETLESASKLLLTSMSSAGVKNPAVKYQYFNSDGTTLVWEYTAS